MEKDYFIGIDIGGTSAKVGLVTSKGQLVDKKNIKTSKIDTWKKI